MVKVKRGAVCSLVHNDFAMSQVVALQGARSTSSFVLVVHWYFVQMERW